MTRRKTILPIIGLSALAIIILGMLAYFGYALYQQDKKLTALEKTTVSDMNQISQIGNYLNSVISSQQSAAKK